MRLRRLRGALGRRADELLPRRPDLRVFAGYCVAAALYIAIGVAVTDFLLSFWVGVLYLLLTAWLVPVLVRRLR
jgi:hypothetical protein